MMKLTDFRKKMEACLDPTPDLQAKKRQCFSEF